MPSDVPEPRPSATVVVAREANELPEILMVQRHAKASFGKAYAFPGGVVEEADRHVHERCAGRTQDEANRILGVADGGLNYFSAAARELFEESGVLLVESGPASASFDAQRRALNAGTLTWDEFLHRHDLRIDCSQLHYFSFWITPEGMPKRYSTRFFLARLPTGQQASHDGGELTDSRWMTPAAVLEAADASEMAVHLPTRRTLQELASRGGLADILDWAAGCGEAGVPCVQPSLKLRADTPRIVVPGQGEYPLDDE